MPAFHRILQAAAGAGGTGTLTQKGYGRVYDTGPTSSLSLSYANVESGSAPVAGDLVVWIASAYDSGSSPIVNRTGSGWAQSISSESQDVWATILAKVVVAGDISSPETIVTSPTDGSIGFWVAYTVTGTISSLSVSSVANEHQLTSAPSSQVCDSSAINPPGVGIAIAMGTGSDNSITLSISGGTADIDFASANDQWLGISSESRFVVNATVGGANLTFSKSDDGNNNVLSSGYVSVLF